MDITGHNLKSMNKRNGCNLSVDWMNRLRGHQPSPDLSAVRIEIQYSVPILMDNQI